MTALVLDSEAFNALAGPITDRRRMVAQLLSAAFGEGRPVIVPTVVLAELYRPGRMAIVDSCLARSEEAPMCRDTDRELARLVGGVLFGGDPSGRGPGQAHGLKLIADHSHLSLIHISEPTRPY